MKGVGRLEMARILERVWSKVRRVGSSPLCSRGDPDKSRRRGAERTNARTAHDFCIKAITLFLKRGMATSLSQALDNFRFGKKEPSWKKARGIVGSVITVADHKAKIGRMVAGEKITQEDFDCLRQDLPDVLIQFAPALAFVDPYTGKRQAEITAEACFVKVSGRVPRNKA